jgi:hypothetical protein
VVVLNYLEYEHIPDANNQNVFIKILRDKLENNLSPTTLAKVTNVGATRLEKLVLKANELAFVREAFSIAASEVTYCGLAVTILGMFFVFALWLSMLGGRRRRGSGRAYHCGDDLRIRVDADYLVGQI